MMKIGIYGGTFNPPHTGHLHAAKQAVQILGLDKLLLIPDRIAPHKEIPTGSPVPQQRLEMLRIAATGEAKMEVSEKGMLLDSSVIPRPDKKLWQSIL